RGQVVLRAGQQHAIENAFRRAHFGRAILLHDAAETLLAPGGQRRLVEEADGLFGEDVVEVGVAFATTADEALVAGEFQEAGRIEAAVAGDAAAVEDGLDAIEVEAAVEGGAG